MHEERRKVGTYRMNFRYYDHPSDDIVVFIHGIPTNSHLWDQVIPFVNQQVKVLVVDLVGYGKSDRAPYYDLTLPKQAAYIIELLNQLGINSAHFVGHDLGGGIVQILATYYSQKVRSIVIADGVAFANWPLPKVVAIRWPIAFEFEPTPLFIERMLREGVYDPQVLTPTIIQHFTKPFSHPSGPLELQQASFALDHDQTEHLVPYLPDIKCATSLLWGQHDRYLPPFWGLMLHQTIPNSRLQILRKCSHYSMLDNPRLFAKEVLTHLSLM